MKRQATKQNLTRWGLLLLVLVVLLLPEQWVNKLRPYLLPQQPQQAQSLPSVEAPNELHCQVFEVLDGDTFTCDINGDGHIQRPNEKIRLLQVDTPETHRSSRNPSGQPQPFGLEAKAFMQKALANKTLRLVLDKKPRDRYGRTLALVYTTENASTSLNEALVEQGLAKAMFYSPNYRLKQVILEKEAQAKTAKRGLWSLEENPA